MSPPWPTPTFDLFASVPFRITLCHIQHHIVKVACDTTVVGLNGDNDDYREGVGSWWTGAGRTTWSWTWTKPKRSSTTWGRTSPDALLSSLTTQLWRWLGVHITDSITYSERHITGKGAHHFLWLMRRSHLPSPIFSTVYKSTQENILTSCLCEVRTGRVWGGRWRQQRWSQGLLFPPTKDFTSKARISRARNVILDASHPHQRQLYWPLGRSSSQQMV